MDRVNPKKFKTTYIEISADPSPYDNKEFNGLFTLVKQFPFKNIVIPTGLPKS